MENTDTFNVYAELNGKFVQMDDRFESVHVWDHELAIKNQGRWTPIEISEQAYLKEKCLAEKRSSNGRA
jgi:hypothetical protein